MLSAISEHLEDQAQLSIIVYSSMKPKKLLESIASMANELDTAGLIVQADLFDDFLNKVTPHFDLTDKLKKRVPAIQERGRDKVYWRHDISPATFHSQRARSHRGW